MIDEDRLHPATRAMIATARALSRNETAPPAARAEPGLADRLLVLERFGPQIRVRAFGDELRKVFGRDLRNEDFCAFLSPADRGLFNALLEAAAFASEPAVARAIGDGRTGLRLGLEIMIAPLDPAIAGEGRFLALVQPLGGEAFHVGPAVEHIRLTGLFPPLTRRAGASLRLVVSNE